MLEISEDCFQRWLADRPSRNDARSPKRDTHILGYRTLMGVFNTGCEISLIRYAVEIRHSSSPNSLHCVSLSRNMAPGGPISPAL
jgi:hypothetical protein